MGVRVWALVAVLVAGLLGVVPAAQAKKYVYAPVVHEGEREVAWYVDWRESPSGDVVGHELEFEYGIGPRDMLAFYLVYEDRAGRDPRFQRYKVEWIRQLWEPGERAVDAGIYLEYQINDAAATADKIEFKPLLQKDIGRITLTGNGILEKEIGRFATGGTELAYAAKAAWRIHPRWTPSVEAFGGIGAIRDITPLSSQAHILGPVVDVRVSRAVAWQVGALFGLTSGSEDVRLKTQVAFEWY
ncbi:MAG: hypothetical protein HZA24_00650 [Nitrospirae bacterium]|nr:hypothetical protein [Nitrospirota bacterium]